MELVNYRPHRAIIRCKAKMQLLQAEDAAVERTDAETDALLKELGETLFQAPEYRVFFEHYHSKRAVKEAEERLANDLAETCRTILKRRQDPTVQSFNALLQ